MGGDRNAGLVIGFGLSLARAPGQILSIAQSAGSSRVRIMQVQARAAIAQLKSGDSRVLNLLAAARCAGWAKRDGASMLLENASVVIAVVVSRVYILEQLGLIKETSIVRSVRIVRSNRTSRCNLIDVQT